MEIDDEDQRLPLLQSSLSSVPLAESEHAVGGGDSIAPSMSLIECYESESRSVESHHRLASLDVFRGLTIALMILVDDAGGAFPIINHAPWFGLTLADFVMPFFLFSVGISISLTFKKTSRKQLATRKAFLRAIKLFLLGVLLQGGYFHGRGNLSYGVDVTKIRWMGVLQRISMGYLVASAFEIWLVRDIAVDSAVTFVKRHYIQWIFTVLLSLVYMCLVYGLYVPSWTFQAPNANNSSSVLKNISDTQTVQCGVRGSLDPPCNAVGLVDRFFLGVQHLYQHPVYRRTKDCSIKSPDYGPLPPNSPAWCLAPFDPEGILSSMMASVTCFVGVHYGHIVLHFKGHMQRLCLWSIGSFPLLILGFTLNVLGIPISKPLYTLSYMCITAGVSGLLLTVIFYIVDIKHITKPTRVFQWMGMNALIIYALAACEIFPAAVQGFYWHSPENNLVDGTEKLLQVMLHSEKWGTLIFVLFEILFWGLVAGVLHFRRIYIKL
ncbi:heparan-alpha-glucosaminide N-acetyltransferase-like [Impatiens glandulifera]|uniref:heparan-alpha-glucosaminide N-acetyltransferase-like n=1 Tax=Impatiens glandulifera TaxID=253017 RepID=UPI001FB07A2F|nr:heparan-alpha-glucosaminide N-acetyltransferase-like [Impatiens glandulifera]